MQMIRFWITRIWNHKAVANYTTLMRLDADSCLKDKPKYPLPHLRSNSSVYMANDIGKKDGAKVTKGLFQFATEYVEKNRLEIQNPALWKIANESQGRRMFFNNLEVTRVSFFQQERVMAFQKALTEFPPFGVFRNRWGDAPVRLLTMAIFGTPDQIDIESTSSYYGHADTCSFFQKNKIKLIRDG